MQMMQDQGELMHGDDSRNYKFHPKVLGICLDILEGDKDFDSSKFHAEMKQEDRAAQTLEPFDMLLIDQIKNDIRTEKWDSLENCKSSKIALNIIMDFMIVF